MDDPIKTYFEDTWNDKIPLGYHTEDVGKPVYHPLTIARVLVYFNPDHLKNKSLKEYSIEWFGMTLDTLKEYVRKGYIVVQLNTRDRYNSQRRDEINDFFRNTEAKTLYVNNIVDDFIASKTSEIKHKQKKKYMKATIKG